MPIPNAPDSAPLNTSPGDFVPAAGANASEPDRAANTSEPPKPSYRPKGKVAWLAKPVRDKIHGLLLDGFSYPAILKALGPDGQSLNVNNLWRYHKGAFRHWLREQSWLAQARLKEEAPAELCQNLDNSRMSQAAVQTTIGQIYDALRDVAPSRLKEMLVEEPRSYARIVNALSRLSKEHLNHQKYREASARTAVLELKRLDPERELSDREHEIFASRMDDLFLRPRRRPPGEAAPNTAPAPAPQTDQTTPHAKDANI